MKVLSRPGSNVGSHPCAGSGLVVVPETPREEERLTALLKDLEKRYPQAIYKDRYESKGLFLPSCCTYSVPDGVPLCGGRPEGAATVARSVLRVLID